MSEDSNFIRLDGAIWIRDVFRAIDGVLVASPTLHHALKRGHVPFGHFEDGRWVPTPLSEGVRRYGNSLVYAIWQQLRAAEALRVAFTGKPGVMPNLIPEEPDEAPGLEPAAPPAPHEGVADQQRLSLPTTADAEP
jgi:hypothetical protein